MLAYVFFHWNKPGVAASDYESLLRRFHVALASSPPAGFSHAYSVGLTGAPWANGGGPSYEDWYVLSGSAALDPLNDAATTGARRQPHGEIAMVSEGGTGGLYRLRLGSSDESPRFAYWFAKPPQMTYNDLYDLLRPQVRSCGGALWGRQMTLGPAPEFCLHAQAECVVPAPCSALEIPLRRVWPLGDI